MRNRKLIRDNVDTVVRILFKYHKLNYDVHRRILPVFQYTKLQVVSIRRLQKRIKINIAANSARKKRLEIFYICSLIC